MTERIAHADAACQLVGPSVPSDRVERVEQAKVHAMLAIAEQLRLSNIIALARLEAENVSTPTDALDALYSRESDEWGPTKLHTRDDVREALGL